MKQTKIQSTTELPSSVAPEAKTDDQMDLDLILFKHLAEQLQYRQLATKDKLACLEFLITTIPGIAIQRIDRNGKIRFWNEASEELYGYKANHAIGRRFEQLLLDDSSYSEFESTLKRAWQNKRTATAAWLLKSAHNENKWVHGTLMPYCLHDTPKALFAIQIDATAYRSTEALLLQHKVQLEERVIHRTKELSQTNKKLQEEILFRKRTEKKLLRSKRDLEKKVIRRTSKLNDAMKNLTEKHQELIQYKNNLETLNNELLETNKAISVLARNIEKRKAESEKETFRTLSEKIMPSIDRLTISETDLAKKAELQSIATLLRKIGARTHRHDSTVTALSGLELKIAHMIKNGLTSKEIARQLFVSTDTVKSHRRNIRKKLRINNTKINLESFLLSQLGSDQEVP